MNQQNNQTISLILLTKNESKNLEKNFGWLDSCKTINEIIIVDDKSTDNTIKIAKSLASKNRFVQIFNRGLSDDFSAQRNFAVSKTKNDWIFWLDADEQPSKKLILFLNHIDKRKYKNYSFKRQDIFLNHQLKHGETAYLNFTRLFNKNYGSFIGQVHEVWESPKSTYQTDLIIKHNSHSTLNSCIQKINFYSTIRAQELFDQKVTTNLFEIIFFPIGKFLQNYIFQLGFLDGTPGIIMALCMSFHVFLSKSKLWHLFQENK
ncbi:MAG: glycosyltransferase family 2 protein [Candidatus Shapirobacteria bacterium]|nr:glycosyltransferase family 2 protein [Candidatus Shapirobacteria bacterium]